MVEDQVIGMSFNQMVFRAKNMKLIKMFKALISSNIIKNKSKVTKYSHNIYIYLKVSKYHYWHYIKMNYYLVITVSSAY